MRKTAISLLAVLFAAGCTAPADRTTVQRPDPVTTVQPVMPRSELTVVAAGDLLVHPPLTDQAAADARAAGRDGHDFTQVLAALRPLVSQAGLAICPMETPLA